MLPEVRDREPLVDMKERGVVYQRPRAYEDIEMPKNSAVGVVHGRAGLRAGLRRGLAHLVAGDRLRACHVGRRWSLRASDDESEFVLSAAEVERIEEARYRALGNRTGSRP